MVLAVVAGVCFLVTSAGLAVGAFGGTTGVVSPESGVALGAMLVCGRRAWPAIFAGVCLAHVAATGAIAMPAALAVGVTVEAGAASLFVDRFAGGAAAFIRVDSLFRFIAIAAFVSAPIGAASGATLSSAGSSSLAGLAYVWLTFWLAHLTGTIVVAPFLVLWVVDPFERVRWTHVIEGAVFLTVFSGVSLLVFGGRSPSDVQDYPLEFLCVPTLLWAAFRFGRRGTATAVLALTGAAFWGTLRGFGPFVRDTPNEALVLVQAYTSVMAMTGLVLAAALGEYRHAEAQLRELATTDSLTGLANYRRLIEVLRAEIARSRRTKRPFAVVFVDMNGLKRINDRHGHLVGSRALTRLADTLRASVRSIDTPARFGGDEFAVVLPETAEEGGRLVLDRIAGRVRADVGQPPISITGGVAVFPRDGESPTLLLRAADKVLYEAKAQGKTKMREDRATEQKTATLF